MEYSHEYVVNVREKIAIKIELSSFYADEPIYTELL